MARAIANNPEFNVSQDERTGLVGARGGAAKAAIASAEGRGGDGGDGEAVAVEDGLGGYAAVLGGLVCGAEQEVFGGEGGQDVVACGNGSVGY